MFWFYYDWTYILVIIGIIISLIASGYMNSTFKKYSKIKAASGLTGRDVAEIIMRKNNLNVPITPIGGNLTDNFDPRYNVLNLSQSTYGSHSIAALGVAAHECGHAIQHNTGYMPIRLRNAFVPVANFGSKIALPLIIIGFIISGASDVSVRMGRNDIGYNIMMVGIICFTLALAFQILTLPVEFNASARGINILCDTGIIRTQEEKRAVKKVLTAAALTYVAAALATFLQLLRFVLIANSRKD
jgi:Zn-dependent membrane protease YugP